ncbi:MAG: alpha-amylase family glycosyl hydrolase [Flavobacteriaceae bacterium]|nr:alpha-amylase family glycosyl hydrolase [Flavobacteriaceae bacterium]
MINESEDEFCKPPKWAQEAIWYQIMVERFYNGLSKNNPVPASMQGAWPGDVDENWKITPWTSDWYQDAPHSQEPQEMRKWYDKLQSRRYGGDLQGVIHKLDYIESLGVNAIYLNPVNDAPSLHKYDTRNYHHVDIHFGPNPEEDKLTISHENPSEPSTWQWTSADLLLLKLIEEVHKRNMKIILDFSFNHTGIEFWAWRDIRVNGINSPFADWYDISMFIKNNPNYPEIHFNSWSGVKELPQFRKKYYSLHQRGFSYRGDIHSEVKKHIFDVTRRWLAPDGDISRGVDGFRLDVADEIGLDFWQDFRKHVKNINSEAFLVGEIWWENWPDRMMNIRPYISNGVFDSVMFYQPYKPVRAFFAKTEEYMGAEGMLNHLKEITDGIPKNNLKALMTMSASHDSPRLLTSFYNKTKYKFHAKPIENQDYKTQKPDEETFRRVKNFLIFQFSMPGAPQIWAGDEMGMWGADDPDCRKPLWWPEFSFEQETKFPFHPDKKHEKEQVGFNQELNLFYKKIIDIRKFYPIFIHGTLQFIYAKNDILIYKRKYHEQTVYLIFNNSAEELYLEHLNLSGIDIWNHGFISSDDMRQLDPISFKIIMVQDEINLKLEKL